MGSGMCTFVKLEQNFEVKSYKSSNLLKVIDSIKNSFLKYYTIDKKVFLS